MNKQTVLEMWDHMRQMHGIGLRVIEAIPADKLDDHPISKMRTPRELAIHMYAGIVRTLIESVPKGEVPADFEQPEKDALATIQTKPELLRFCRECWDHATKIVENISDDQLRNAVKTPWGKSFPGFVMFRITKDEYLHHRGQLYAYVRALGAEPPMVSDFANNAPEYQPKQAAHTA